jgi:GLPGLI family protein
MRLLHFLWFICFVFNVAELSAQDSIPEFEGTIRYLNTHSWTKKMAAMKFVTQQQRERNAYLYGNDEWKIYTVMYISPAGSRYEDSEEQVENDGSTYSWRKENFQVKRDFKSATMYDILTISGKTYIVEDSIRYQGWKIKNDLKEVAGYLCMNAVWQDTIKDQQIEVWFALDLPVSCGPERLGGLPGVILEANINNGALHIVADKIEPKLLTTELNLPKKKYKGEKVTEAGYQRALKAYVDEQRKQEQVWWNIRY